MSEFGRGIEPALRKALKSATSNDARFRIDAILDKFEVEASSPQETRRRRAARVLELIDTKQARELRKIIP